MPRSTPILKLLSQSAAIWRPASDRGPHSESLRSWCRVFLSAMLLAAATFSAPYVGAVQAQASAVSFCNGDRSVNSYGFSLDENTESNTVVGTVAACKPHSDSLTYSVGGTDVAKFNNVFDLNASTGEITVKSGASPNYEAYNSYSLTVTVTDAEDSSEATVPMSITVRNVDEPGIVTLSTSSPQVGVQVRASLYDPDGLIGGVFRSMWSRANVATGPFFLTRDEFERNNRNLYFTPNVDNRYRYLKFTIYYLDQTCPDVYSHSYVDRHGQPCLKKAEVVSESVVANADGLIIQRQSTNTPATGNVRITFYGEIRVGRSLHGDVLNAQDEDGTQSLRGHLTKFSWQWFRIDPRTLAEERVRHPEHPTWNWTYVVQDADRGKGIQARVSFLDDSGNTETLRSEIQLIPAPPNNAATGSPVITGTAQVGETLTADTDDLQDTDGIVTSTLTYQWFANDGTENTATESATSSTYTLVTDDEGKTITVQVAFSDEFGYTEALTSAPTASVAPRDTRSQRSQQQNGPGITGTAPTIKGSPALSDSGSDYEWTPGETVQVTLTFSEEVNVDTTDGTPSIGIQLGGTLDHNASYASGSGTTKLVFSYTLADDDGRHSSMFVPGDSLTLNGGTITSASSGGDAALGHTGAARSSFAVAAVPNSAATGEPTISGTAQVGQMLTASTSDISDSDGLINATFTYQWIANDGTEDTDIQDATGSTYTLAAADEGKTIKVRVSFTDDGGNQETRTSAVTVAVAAAPSPLTVSVESAPTSHDGSDSFRIRIAFSEAPKSGFSYTTMRDHAFTVTGGSVTGARRLVSGENLRWEITVQPSGNADVTVVLSATTNCAAQGAICADVDKKLSSPLTLTVNAPEATPPPAIVESALTVSVESAPTSHDGSDSFRIRIAFSEAPKSGFSYTTMRDHAFTVTGGSVTGARRLVSGENLRWEITVQPSGNADVTVVLSATTNCAAQGAICADVDKKLSNRLERTVSGPGQ